MNDRGNVLLEKSMSFAVRIVNLCKFLRQQMHETVLSSQVLRSGTSIGANAHEANSAQSKADFVSKCSIALKECDETVLYRALGFARECCCDCSFGWESSLRNIRVSPSLRNWEEVNGPQSGGGIRIEATAASPTVGGASLTYDIYDETNGLFRTVTRHVTAANVRCRQDRDDREWDADDRLMEDWYGPQWTVYRRDEPYVFWVDCEKPSDMEFGISCTQTNRLISVLSDSAFPREYQVDASCSNTTFDVRCVLSVQRHSKT